MKNPIITISVVNFKTTWGNKTANLGRMCSYASAAAAQGANLIVLPELALTGYDDEKHKERPIKMQTLLAEPIPGPSSLALAQIAKTTGTYVVFGMPEQDTDHETIIYNTAVVCSPDGGIQTFRKFHMPFGEADWATRGEEAMFLDTPFGVIGVGICYDCYKFPELLRLTRAHGGNLFLNVTALPFEDILPNVNREDLESFVYHSNIYVASANLVGLDLVKHFMGGSSILGPDGDDGCLYYSGYAFGDERGQQTGIFTATIDLSLCEKNPAYDIFSNTNGHIPWRPALYAAMCEDILNDQDWQRKVR